MGHDLESPLVDYLSTARAWCAIVSRYFRRVGGQQLGLSAVNLIIFAGRCCLTRVINCVLLTLRVHGYTPVTWD